MGVSARGNARILLGVNFILLFGFTFVFLFILLEKSVDMYDWLYNSTSKIQTIIVYCWFLAAGLVHIPVNDEVLALFLERLENLAVIESNLVDVENFFPGGVQFTTGF